eukprot:401443_1
MYMYVELKLYMHSSIHLLYKLIIIQFHSLSTQINALLLVFIPCYGHVSFSVCLCGFHDSFQCNVRDISLVISAAVATRYKSLDITQCKASQPLLQHQWDKITAQTWHP